MLLHVSEWWAIEMFFLESVWDTMCRAPEFFPYYELALRIIGKKYLDKNSSIRDGISQRWQRVYFKDLKKSEDQDLDADAQRKAKALHDESDVLAKQTSKYFSDQIKAQSPVKE